MIIKSNKLYDHAKWIALVFLPAFGTLVFALGEPLNYESGTPVGVIMAVDAFIGAILGISNKQYNATESNFDGDLFIAEDGSEFPELTSAWNEHPDEFKEKSTVTLRVKKVPKERLAKKVPLKR